MCGILGINEDNKPLVTKAARTIAYRGPDAFGISADGKVTLGHNRLSIIDLDARSTQPFFDASGKTGIVYNGEIYNYQKLKDELQKTGKYQFRTTSDTEVLLYAYQEWGEAMVSRLEGMYAFAIYDAVRERIVLCTDQAAIKPLFYAHTGGTFVFASEAKTILAMLREKGLPVRVDTGALSLYYALGCIPAPRTLYEGVCRLQPRVWGVYDLQANTYTQTLYPLPELSAHTPHEMQERIEESVRRHLVADVPVGLFFSGGTDSSLIAAALHKMDIQLEAFCVEIADRPEDAQYSREIAKALGLSLHEYAFGPKEFDEVYKTVVERLDEPLADSSVFPTYFVAHKAAEKVKVVLSGEGGDEYFFGYPRSYPLQKLMGTRLDAETNLVERLFFVLPAFRGKNKLFEKLFVWLRRPVAFYLLTMSPTKSRMGFAAWREAKRALAAGVAGPETLDADVYLPNDLLRKTDMATMYNSIEGRVPLLAPDIMAAARATPQLLSGRGELKPLLKKILSLYVPKRLVYRKKTGFGLRTKSFFAQSAYMRGDLRAAVEYLSTRGYLLVDVPQEGELVARYPNLCWQLLSLYHVLRNAHI